MAAIIRVKRRIDEQPQNAFVLNCKKRKTDEPSNNPQHSSLLSNNCETSTILKFAGTVTNQDDSITSHISKLTKEEAKSKVTKNRVPANTTNRCREETKLNSQENRFKIVNCYRASNDSQGEESKNVTVVDVESNVPVQEEEIPISATIAATSATLNDAQQSSNNFVYDLYLPDTNDLTEMDTNLVNDLLSIHPLNDVYDGRYGDYGKSSSDNDSEDSNDENNWRNEYPDEDDGSTGGDDDGMGDNDIEKAVNNLCIDDDLSTDDDNLFSNDADDDENRYGRAYARYKRRLNGKSSSDDNSNSNDDISNSDDDSY